MVPLQRHLRERQSEADEVLWVRLHRHRVTELRQAKLPRFGYALSDCWRKGSGDGGKGEGEQPYGMQSQGPISFAPWLGKSFLGKRHAGSHGHLWNEMAGSLLAIMHC